MTTIWIDAHLSPAIAVWLTNTFDVTALALRDLGLRDAENVEIFMTITINQPVLPDMDLTLSAADVFGWLMLPSVTVEFASAMIGEDAIATARSKPIHFAEMLG